MKYTLKAARVGKGIKQGVMAKELGITPQYLNKIEKGLADPRKDLMVKISEMLGIPVNVLFFKENE